MPTFKEAAFYVENGVTYYFKDKTARDLLKKCYSPSNPPPYPVTPGGRIWYATCSTASGTGAKTATTSTGDFALATGSMVRILFTTSNTATNPTISIDGSTAKYIRPVSGSSGMANKIAAGEVVDLVYDGSNFVMTKGSAATTSFYGFTKLNSSTSSTSTSEAATPSAVKEAYDSAERRLDLYLGVEIPDHANLNDYTTPGVYYSSSAGHSETMLNGPTISTGFKLVVGRTIASTRVFQIAILNDGVPTICKRYYNDNWSAWIRSLDESWLPLSVSRGGTGGTDAATALANLGGAPLLTVNNTANTTYTFNVNNSSRFVLITIAAQAASKGLYIFNTTSAGAITRADVFAASEVSFTNSTNILTVTSARTGTFGIFTLNGAVSLST